jgi:hypothetical protein
LLFNTIARETSELRGGFSAVPSGLDLADGMRILEHTDPKTPPNTMARMSSASFKERR